MAKQCVEFSEYLSIVSLFLVWFCSRIYEIFEDEVDVFLTVSQIVFCQSVTSVKVSTLLK